MKLLRKISACCRTFLVYFLLSGFVVTCSFLLFFKDLEIPEESVHSAAVVTFLNILLLTAVFVVIDELRRKFTVDRPVQKIRDALRQITGGDFSVRLDPRGSNPSFGAIMENINQMTQELSGVKTLRTDFIANVSHEMKTPLSAIQNYGTLLQEPGLSEEKRLEYARAVTDGCRRLSNLMTNILKLNRLENQQIYPQNKTYDLGEQLCACLLQYESVWEQAEIELHTELAEDVTVQADEELLSLVWNNLLSNAFKFTEPGGTVSVSLTADETCAVVTVSDTGCGMTPEVGVHIFEKFYQGDTSHATAGNGLGLALVKRIMEITGGEISVSSAAGVGSTFTVRVRRKLHEGL